MIRKEQVEAFREATGRSAVGECDKGNDAITKGNRIDITFDPEKSDKKVKCEKIVHVQFVRKYGDGKVIKPGDFNTNWKYRDKVTTDAGWGVDHLAGETSPDYQQGTGEGKKNGDSSKATMMDAPTTSGGDKGFYDPKTNPTGWKTYRNEFATFAYCMKGADCGKWYSGMTWEYTKTWQSADEGTSTAISKDVEAPSKEHLDAFDKFNTEKGFTPCK